MEFVYPKQKATELAQANQQPVLSVREDATDAASMTTATVEPVAPAPVTVADNPQDSTEIAQVTVVETEELLFASVVPTDYHSRGNAIVDQRLIPICSCMLDTAAVHD